MRRRTEDSVFRCAAARPASANSRSPRAAPPRPRRRAGTARPSPARRLRCVPSLMFFPKDEIQTLERTSGQIEGKILNDTLYALLSLSLHIIIHQKILLAATTKWK